MTDNRALARHLFDVGVAAADPYGAVARAVADVPAPALIIAVGKAATRMAQAALSAFPVQCIIVTNYENATPVVGAQVFAAGHPVPDMAGAKAAHAVIKALGQATGPVLVLISGGGSALLPAPAGLLTLSDKSALNKVLLASGLSIGKMNLIRQQVSDLKGGGMLRQCAYPVTTLILSDVVGDDLSTIASGPTAPPLGTPTQAIAVLREAGIWEATPLAVRSHLETARGPSALPLAHNVLVGSNSQSVAAMVAAQQGISPIPMPVEGDVSAAARLICDHACPGITVWGGETTVQISGTGKGGRNQELALRIACEATRRGWDDFTCLAGGTDGRDGPVDAAGGLVDAGTLGRIAAAGGDIDALLANNDSYAALGLAGDLLMTGATGTNVADLGVLIR
ncbi:MAG: DUF4147 domain-containing protein [Yoonia sp.]|nr:DUF4147 domain-containing protein [Yoonia sp.]